MEILMDMTTGRLLYREEIEAMAKDPSQREMLKSYMISAKVALAAQSALDYLNELDKKPSELTAQEIQDLCNVLFFCIRFEKWDKVEEYLRKAVGCANEMVYKEIPLC